MNFAAANVIKHKQIIIKIFQMTWML